MTIIAGARYGDIDSGEPNMINTSGFWDSLDIGFWIGTKPEEKEEVKTASATNNIWMWITIIAAIIVVVLLLRR